MSKSGGSRVFSVAETQAEIPPAEHSVIAFRRGPLDVALSLPVRPRPQTPHAQDEIYFIIRGRVLIHDGKRDVFESGDLLFVAAGIEHQFEDTSEDFAIWRVFYGPEGGEVLWSLPKEATVDQESAAISSNIQTEHYPA